MKALSITRIVWLILVPGIALGGCGDEPSDPRTLCGGADRLAAYGEVGPLAYDLVRAAPYPGVTGTTYLTVALESGEEPHLIGLSTNTDLGMDLWSLMSERLRGGGDNAGQLTVTARPLDIPCDPREGVICVSYGVDTNRDGILFGAAEIIYPAVIGELELTDISGNTIQANFQIDFGPLESGTEELGERGGSLSGCFVLNRTPDGRHLF